MMHIRVKAEQTEGRKKKEVIHTYVTSNVGIQARENDGTLFEVFRNARIYDKVAHTRRYGSCLLPICDDGVCFPC
jgi:hypothetical protein